jgi:hypothetical protein
MPRATRTTSIKNPGTVIINPPPASPPGPTVETTTSPKKIFWEEQQVLNTAEGKEYVIYLYRLQPSGPGYGGQVAKFSEPVTIDQIAESFGGYEYRISLHRGSKWICSEIFKVAAPPKMMGMADPAVIAGMPHAAAGDATAQVSQVLQFVNQRLDKERMERKDDPVYQAQINLLQKTAEQAITQAYAQNRNPAAEQIQNNMMTMMMNMMNTVTSALLQRSLQAPEKTAMSGIKEVLDLLTMMGLKMGGGGGKLDAGTILSEKLIDVAPKILESAVPLLERWQAVGRERTIQEQLRFNALMIQRGQAPIPVSAPQPVTAANPPAAQGAIPPPTAQPAQGNAGLNTVPFPENGIPASQAVPSAGTDGAPNDDWLKRKVVELIGRGASGDMLMAVVSGINENFALTMQASSEEMIRMFFAADPILKQALQFPNFDQCLSEAIAYLHPEGQPAPAQAN